MGITVHILRRHLLRGRSVLNPKDTPAIKPHTAPAFTELTAQQEIEQIQSTATQSNTEKTDSNNLFSTSSSGPGKFYSPLPNDQLLKTLTEKNRQWFSLLPRTPCDDTSLTHAGMSTASLVTPQSQPLSKSPSPAPAALLGSSAQNPVGLNPFALSPLQVGAVSCNSCFCCFV